MIIGYIKRHKKGFFLADSAARIARDKKIPVRSIRMDYPRPKAGREQRMKKARNQRKQVRRRMATRVPLLIWFSHHYRSRHQAHLAAAALGCTHTSWRGKLSKCPSPEQLGLVDDKGRVNQARTEQFLNP